MTGQVEFSSEALDSARGRLRARFGASVESWWEVIPGALAELAERWEITLGEPVGRGNTSLVVRCRLIDGRAAVLKVTPDPEMADAEMCALRRWAPSGRVPLVWGYDATLGALLLEAMPSETPLAEQPGPVPLHDIAELIGALHRSGAPAAVDGVVSLADRVEFIFDLWIERYVRAQEVSRAVPVERLERGRDQAFELALSPGKTVLLHGDLHPGNVLDGGATRGFVAIDPRPCLGDAAVDAVDWVFWAADDSEAWQARCRELAAALDVDRQRMWSWCGAFAAMLAASTAARDGRSDRVDALLAIAP